MYLANKDLQHAINTGRLIFRPPPEPDSFDTDSIDVTLGELSAARIIDEQKFTDNWESNRLQGATITPFPSLSVGKFSWKAWEGDYLCPPPTYTEDLDGKVFVYEGMVVLKPGGYVIWSTREVVGTPEENPEFVVYIDGKSTRARTGLVIHLTAPHIHAGWAGPITLEIANLGGLNLALGPGDKVAQIRAARLTDVPLPRSSEREIDSDKLA